MKNENPVGVDPDKAVRIKPVLSEAIRHPIRAARLLYSLPPFLLRGAIYLIFLIVFSGLLYSFWATKSIIVAAPLTLEKESFTQQVSGDGLVIDLKANENAIVRAGDPIAVVREQLRPFDNAQRQAMEGQKLDLMKERDKVESEYQHRLSQLEFDLDDLKNNRGGRIEQLEGKIAVMRKQLGVAKNAKGNADKSFAIARRQYDRIRTLYASRDVTVAQHDQALEKFNSAQKIVFDASAQTAEIEISLQTAEGELAKFKDLRQQEKNEREMEQVQAQRDRDLGRLDERIAGIDARLNAAQVQEGATFRDNEVVYSSLFDGVITGVHVNRNQIIAAGSPLVTLVRDTAVLEGHAYVRNQDIGQLKRGQEVKIKYYAYPYQEYGISSGLISFIATTPNDKSLYLVKVALRSDTIQRAGSAAKRLEIGLEGTAEFKTGVKRFIEILFTPISKFFAAEEGS